MKKYILSLIALLTLTNCEDKVNIPLDTAEPKLVIEANVFWQKGTTGNEQSISLTTTTSYYSTVIPTVSNAVVTITNSTNVVFNFIETVPNSGKYNCSNFIPIINESYTLTVVYNNQTYTSTEKLLATPVIQNVEQTTFQGFSGNQIQVKFFFQDNGNELNNYLIGIKNSNKIIPEYGVEDDDVFQGNLMFGFYTEEPDKLKSGTVLDFSLAAISSRYYNYMNKLLNIAGSSNGSPFATPPATLRGNIVNQSNPENYPLGYFHLSEIDKLSYTVE